MGKFVKTISAYLVILLFSFVFLESFKDFRTLIRAIWNKRGAVLTNVICGIGFIHAGVLLKYEFTLLSSGIEITSEVLKGFGLFLFAPAFLKVLEGFKRISKENT